MCICMCVLRGGGNGANKDMTCTFVRQSCAQTQTTGERVWERDFAKQVGMDLKCGWS